MGAMDSHHEASRTRAAVDLSKPTFQTLNTSISQNTTSEQQREAEKQFKEAVKQVHIAVGDLMHKTGPWTKYVLSGTVQTNGQQVRIKVFHLRHRWPKKEDCVTEIASSSSSSSEPAPSSNPLELAPSSGLFTLEDAGYMADDLLSLTVNSLKMRARMALTKVKLKDARRQTTNANSKVASDQSYQQMRKIWHCPPHIVKATDKVTFGDMWPVHGKSTGQTLLLGESPPELVESEPPDIEPRDEAMDDVSQQLER
ncbi:hypothetical protein BGZ73_007185, partial [Actinomortierella ambigua]